MERGVEYYSKVRWAVAWDYDPAFPALVRAVMTGIPPEPTYFGLFTDRGLAESWAARMNGRPTDVAVADLKPAGGALEYLRQRQNQKAEHVAFDPPLDGDPALMSVENAILHLEMAAD